ncbi:response regulator transcription factor [Ascidiimonas aurantiaca]|uniref:response regulator transcription factor n=1 Tax=Ascidiimonas aurantiaca TaxID=1685432 RepID=UPI0030EE4A4E
MKPRIKILLAEDEAALGQIIKESLESRDFEVLYCENGEKAYEIYVRETPDLLVLDVMMPKKDGFTLAGQIRKTDRKTPIIFLTAKSQTRDVVEGFNYGGNDYIKKPFSMEELIVRIHALLDRIRFSSNEKNIEIGAFVFNYPGQSLTIHGNTQLLTHREAQLLYHLIEKKNEILDRSFILKHLWGDDDFFSARSMDVFITKLRKKLSKDPDIRILNVRGFGYKLIC